MNFSNKTQKIIIRIFIIAVFILGNSKSYAELYMSISGAVIDAETQFGIAGVEILAIKENAPPEEARTVTTGKNGIFILRSIPAGKYEFYIKQIPNYAVNRKPFTVILDKGKNVVDLSIELIKSGSISGFVYNHDGTPVKNAIVGAYTPEGNVIFGSSDENGKYLISNIKETNMATIAVLPDGYSGVFKENISVRKGQQTQGINFIIDPDLSTGITGVVKGTDGSLISNAIILLYGEKGGGHTITDSSGKFTIFGLVPSNYTAKIVASGFQISESNIQIFYKKLTENNFVLTPNISTLSAPEQNVHLGFFDLTVCPAVSAAGSFDMNLRDSFNYPRLIKLIMENSESCKLPNVIQDCRTVMAVCGATAGKVCETAIVEIPEPRAKFIVGMGCFIIGELYCTIHINNLKKNGYCK